MRFSHGSDEVIEGNRPRSCLNFKARFASGDATMILILGHEEFACFYLGQRPCSPALPAVAASAQQNNGGDGVLEREPHGP
jgi:hypothetical protein